MMARRAVDPMGRLDVAVFETVNRLFARYCPEAAKVLSLHEREVRALLAKHMGPGTRNKRARLVRNVVRTVHPLMVPRRVTS